MFITKETDYALRLLRAMQGRAALTPVADVCETALLPRQFAYKIIKKMQSAGFVEVARGADGGCRLAEGVDLRKISLFDLVAAVESNRRISACLAEGYACAWRDREGAAGAGDGAHGACTINRRLDRIQEALEGELRRHSVYDMLYDDVG